MWAWGPIVQLASIRVLPLTTEKGMIVVSASMTTPASMKVLAGSTMVTPASIRSSRMRSRTTPSARANSTRSLTARTAVGSSAL